MAKGGAKLTPKKGQNKIVLDHKHKALLHSAAAKGLHPLASDPKIAKLVLRLPLVQRHPLPVNNLRPLAALPARPLLDAGPRAPRAHVKELSVAGIEGDPGRLVCQG
jgi:hypothetical protein